LLRKAKSGGQGPNLAVEPHDDVYCRYEMQAEKEVPVWYTGTYRPISNTAPDTKLRTLFAEVK
jgi:hypothetical protein